MFVFNCICLKAPDLKIYSWPLHLVYFLISGPFHLLFLIYLHLLTFLWASWDFPGGVSGKEPACQCRKQRVMGSIPGSGRSPGEGNGNPLQCSWLENPTDRGACWAAVHRVAKSRTRLKQLSTDVAPSFTFLCSSFRLNNQVCGFTVSL